MFVFLLFVAVIVLKVLCNVIDTDNNSPRDKDDSDDEFILFDD